MTMRQSLTGGSVFVILAALSTRFIVTVLFNSTTTLPVYLALIAAYLAWVWHVRNIQTEELRERVFGRQLNQQFKDWGIL